VPAELASSAMRTLRILVIVATLAVALPFLDSGVAHAKSRRPRAELVAKDVTGFVAGGKITASASVKNKGDHKARRSRTTFVLSKDATVSADDKVVGTVGTVRIRPKRSKTASGTFALPASAAAGSWRLIACADSGRKVKERRERNNCKASRGTVTVVRQITIGWSVSGGIPPVIQGAVTATATGGSCTAPGVTGSCTVNAGASTVTLTAGGEIPALLTFTSWGPATGGACVGTTSGLKGETLTITNPTAEQGCVAAYIP
jgi:hypothetical protein